jgi:hypothetical protein
MGLMQPCIWLLTIKFNGEKKKRINKAGSREDAIVSSAAGPVARRRMWLFFEILFTRKYFKIIFFILKIIFNINVSK